VTSGTAGRACVRSSDCGAGGGCIANGEGWPNGYCIYGCGSGATPGDECAGGTGICLEAGGAQLLCFRDCVPGTAGACRSGYVCESVTEDDSLGVCTPDCRVNPGATCGASRCDTSTGNCFAAMCMSASSCSLSSTCAAGSCECGALTNCGANRRCYPRVGSAPARCGCTSSAACPSDRACDTATGRCL